jgi:hypothetical protein
MKKIIPLLILTGFLAGSCHHNDKAAEKEKEPKKDTVVNTVETIQPVERLDSLRNYEGKYPTAVKLLDDPILKPRLEKLLGSRFAFLKEYWNAETPIEIKDNILTTTGCQAHNCGSTNFIIVADLSKNILSVGIREEDKVQRYIESGNSPDALEKWVTGN